MASRAAVAGLLVILRFIQELLGHLLTSTMRRYTHVDEGILIGVLESVHPGQSDRRCGTAR